MKSALQSTKIQISKNEVCPSKSTKINLFSKSMFKIQPDFAKLAERAFLFKDLHSIFLKIVKNEKAMDSIQRTIKYLLETEKNEFKQDRKQTQKGSQDSQIKENSDLRNYLFKFKENLKILMIFIIDNYYSAFIKLKGMRGRSSEHGSTRQSLSSNSNPKARSLQVRKEPSLTQNLGHTNQQENPLNRLSPMKKLLNPKKIEKPKNYTRNPKSKNIQDFKTKIGLGNLNSRIDLAREIISIRPSSFDCLPRKAIPRKKSHLSKFKNNPMNKISAAKSTISKFHKKSVTNNKSRFFKMKRFKMESQKESRNKLGSLDRMVKITKFANQLKTRSNPKKEKPIFPKKSRKFKNLNISLMTPRDHTKSKINFLKNFKSRHKKINTNQKKINLKKRVNLRVKKFKKPKICNSLKISFDLKNDHFRKAIFVKTRVKNSSREIDEVKNKILRKESYNGRSEAMTTKNRKSKLFSPFVDQIISRHNRKSKINAKGKKVKAKSKGKSRAQQSFFDRQQLFATQFKNLPSLEIIKTFRKEDQKITDFKF